MRIEINDLLHIEALWGHGKNIRNRFNKRYMVGIRKNTDLIHSSWFYRTLRKSRSFLIRLCLVNPKFLLVTDDNITVPVLRNICIMRGDWLDGTLTNYRKTKKLLPTFDFVHLQNYNKFTIPTCVLLFTSDEKKFREVVSEAHDMEIPVVAAMDTNNNPNPVAYPIVMNDNSLETMELVCNYIMKTIAMGYVGYIRRIKVLYKDRIINRSWKNKHIGIDKVTDRSIGTKRDKKRSSLSIGFHRNIKRDNYITKDKSITNGIISSNKVRNLDIRRNIMNDNNTNNTVEILNFKRIVSNKNGSLYRNKPSKNNILSFRRMIDQYIFGNDIWQKYLNKKRIFIKLNLRKDLNVQRYRKVWLKVNCLVRKMRIKRFIKGMWKAGIPWKLRRKKKVLTWKFLRKGGLGIDNNIKYQYKFKRRRLTYLIVRKRKRIYFRNRRIRQKRMRIYFYSRKLSVLWKKVGRTLRRPIKWRYKKIIMKRRLDYKKVVSKAHEKKVVVVRYGRELLGKTRRGVLIYLNKEKKKVKRKRYGTGKITKNVTRSS